jgi:alkylated DNA repair dioxygenase AlkB
MEPLPWLHPLHELRRLVSKAAGCNFNSVLVNLYRDGNDSMGWHSDNEPELGAAPVIASISLGATRDFHVRSRRGAGDVQSIPLTHGSLLVMHGSSQSEWQHALPRRKRVTEPRINLTFRLIHRL